MTSIPASGPPATLDFSPDGLNIDFLTLSPALGQVFYIGDGLTSLLAFQEFIAPTGATRLFLGIPDGFGFVGAPGAYDDNDGSYRVRIGVNEIPERPGTLDTPSPWACAARCCRAEKKILSNRIVSRCKKAGPSRALPFFVCFPLLWFFRHV